MNTLNILKAFAEGLRLIITPSILPVLPIILAASLDGGKRKPYGVVFGFAFAFVGIALVAHDVFAAMKIDPQTLKMLALVILLGVGLSMLFPTISQWMSRNQRMFQEGEEKVVDELSHRWEDEGGFFSGLMIGIVVALAWAPYAAPIMADALEQVRLQTDPQSAAVVALYAVGAGIPMLFVAKMMRILIKSSPALNQSSLMVRAILGLVILMSIAVIFAGIDQKLLPMATPGPGTGIELEQPPPQEKAEVPALRQTPPVKPPPAKRPPKPAPKGLPVIKPPPVAPLAPLTAEPRKPAPRKPAPKGLPVIKPPPVAPLAPISPPLVEPTQPPEPRVPPRPPIRVLPPVETTPAPPPREAAPPSLRLGQNAENYLGTQRERGGVLFYDPAENIAVGNWSLNGRWRVEDDKIVAASPRATLRLRFKARRVYAVMAVPQGTFGKASIFLNGKPIRASGGNDVDESNVHINGRGPYELVNKPEPTEGLLDIVSCVPGLEIYAITFEN